MLWGRGEFIKGCDSRADIDAGHDMEEIWHLCCIISPLGCVLLKECQLAFSNQKELLDGSEI